MVGVDRKKMIAVIALAIAAGVLTGCAASPGGSGQVRSGGDLSLSETKSPVQLLRNDAAGRIPTDVIRTVEAADDVSVACLDEAQDPDGALRSWHSTAIVTIEDAATDRIQGVVSELIGTYTDQGWLARGLGGSATIKNNLLTSETSIAEIRVASKLPDLDAVSTSTDETVEIALIEIQVHGPCVATAGADSDEVRSLERS